VKGKEFARVTVYGSAYLTDKKAVLLERTQDKWNEKNMLFRI
jgi:hypothetical protein